MKEELVDRFVRYWKKKADKGQVSPLDRMEKLAIELFIGWLVQNYEVVIK